MGGPGPSLLKTELLPDFHWWAWHLLLPFLRRRGSPKEATSSPSLSLRYSLPVSDPKKCSPSPSLSSTCSASSSGPVGPRPEVCCSDRAGQEVPPGQGHLCRPESTWSSHWHLLSWACLGWGVWKQCTTAHVTEVWPHEGVGQPDWPQVTDFDLQSHEKARPPQLTPSGPEFGGRAQEGRTHSGSQAGL